MTIPTFILKNALRNKRRAILSISSVAASLFLLVTLQVALRELTLPPESAGAELRVAVRNRISLTNPLPVRQRSLIEKIPGVAAITPFTWFGSLPEFHYLTGTYPTGLTCGDLNNDGRNDIIVFGAKVEVYYSLASGLQEVLLCEHQTDGFIEDFNHDGKKDIICFDDLAMIGLTGVTMFENTGSGNFIKHDEIVFPFSTSEFLLSDFDNDSLPDILFRLLNKSGYIIYNNQGGFQLGDSAFVPVVDYGEHWRNSFCADLDGNGYNDVITIRTSGVVLPANLDIKFNDGKGHFVDHPLGIKNKVNEIQPFKCFPNPFCDQTLFEFNLSTTELVNLSIYDVGGKLVTCLIDEKLEAGKYNVAWKRNDLNKKPCDPGLYFAILKLNGEPKRILKLVIY